MSRLLKTFDDKVELRGYDIADTIVKAEDDPFELSMVGSTDTVDRDNEVIEQGGWDLSAYKHNPVILPAHNYMMPSIGKAISVSVQGGKLMFKIRFPDEGIFPLADIYRKLYRGGFMKASSVGFRAIEWIDGRTAEFRRKFTKVELYELSLVSVPCNPDAVVQNSVAIERAAKGGALSGREVKLFHDIAVMSWKDAGADESFVKAFSESLRKGGAYVSDANDGQDKGGSGGKKEKEKSDVGGAGASVAGHSKDGAVAAGGQNGKKHGDEVADKRFDAMLTAGSGENKSHTEPQAKKRTESAVAIVNAIKEGFAMSEQKKEARS